MKSRLFLLLSLLLFLPAPTLLAQATSGTVRFRHVLTQAALASGATVLYPNEPGIADDKVRHCVRLADGSGWFCF